MTLLQSSMWSKVSSKEGKGRRFSHIEQAVAYIKEYIDGHGVQYMYCRQSEERLGESNLCKPMAGAVPSITDIYSLAYTQEMN